MILEIDANYLRRSKHTISDVEALLSQQGYVFYLWENGKLERTTGLQDRRNNILIHPSRPVSLRP